MFTDFGDLQQQLESIVANLPATAKPAEVPTQMQAAKLCEEAHGEEAAQACDSTGASSPTPAAPTPVAPTDSFQVGDEVEYWSVSLNCLISARVEKQS